MQLIIHRGSREIGGSCVELSTKNSRLLIDAGSPLPQKNDFQNKEEMPESLKVSLKLSHSPFEGILISHAHQDHYGILDKLPSNIPVYLSKGTDILIKATIQSNRKNLSQRETVIFNNQERFSIGEFSITPYLVDHSAMDAYSFLIQADGKNIFYTGDFREHGRKPYLLEETLPKLPKIDAVLMEGTMVGQERDADIISEDDLKLKFIDSIKQTKGAVFVTLSSQNIDRIVTVFKACSENKRLLTIDPYTAEILDKIKEVFPRIPNPSWKDVVVCYPKDLCNWLKNNGRDDINKRYLKYGKPWEYFSQNASRIVMLARPSGINEIKKYFDLSQSKWIYSMWKGYIEKDNEMAKLADLFLNGGAAIDDSLHTSGHASTETLRKVADQLKLKMVIPIHTLHPEKYSAYFKNVMEVSDGQEIEI